MERHFQVEYETWHVSVRAHWKSILGEEVSFGEAFLMIRGKRSHELLRPFGWSAAGDEDSVLKCAPEHIRVCTGFHTYNGLSCERRALRIISEPAFIKNQDCWMQLNAVMNFIKILEHQWFQKEEFMWDVLCLLSNHSCRFSICLYNCTSTLNCVFWWFKAGLTYEMQVFSTNLVNFV